MRAGELAAWARGSSWQRLQRIECSVTCLCRPQRTVAARHFLVARASLPEVITHGPSCIKGSMRLPEGDAGLQGAEVIVRG